MLVIIKLICVSGQQQVGYTALLIYSGLSLGHWSDLTLYHMSFVLQRQKSGLYLRQSKRSNRKSSNKQDFSACLIFIKANHMAEVIIKEKETLFHL